MAEFVKLAASGLQKLRNMDERLVSYNVEMTEVTGGTFWKAYTDAQVDGTEEFPVISNWMDMGNLQQWYDPIDLYNPRLRKLAKDLGTAWVRVSGTWANKTYYDLENKCNGVVPAGYQNLLTKEQWIGVLEFVKHINGKLLVSMTNCPGVHAANEPYPLELAEKLFAFSAEYGVPIDAAEFTNEPNMMAISGLPEGYTAADHARDHDIFGAWLRENYPDCLFVGPCTVGDLMEGVMFGGRDEKVGGGIASALQMVATEELLGENKVKMDHFSYHYYNGVSERGAAMGGHWPVEAALTEEYLAVAGQACRSYLARRDRYTPGGQLWVTESGDAGCGGNTWAPTYIDVPRTLNELGEFASLTDGIIFHNTLASSAYGYLEHGSFEPRPNYFAVLLWNRLMGKEVYASGEAIREGAHVYCHSRKDGQEGYVYLVINNSQEATKIELPGNAVQYALTGNGKMRSRTMLLNGKELVLGENDALPELSGVAVSGTVEVAPGGCTFFVI